VKFDVNIWKGVINEKMNLTEQKAENEPIVWFYNTNYNGELNQHTQFWNNFLWVYTHDEQEWTLAPNPKLAHGFCIA
jgi:hypothetical protein